MKRETKNKFKRRICQNPNCEAVFTPKHHLEVFCKADNDKLIKMGIKPLHQINNSTEGLLLSFSNKFTGENSNGEKGGKGKWKQ